MGSDRPRGWTTARRRGTGLLLTVLLGACATATPPPHQEERTEGHATKKAKPDPRRISTSIVSVIVNRRGYDWSTPWSMQRPWTNWMTGLVLEGKRILVAGGSLGDTTLVEVQKMGQPKRYRAHLELVDYEIPLGIIAVDDADFWTDLVPLPLAAELPRDGNVTIHRWISSGQLEDARGKIRQVTVTDHWPARTQVLSLDISAGIENAGFSEVVLYRDQVIGLSTVKNESRLYAIGSPVIRDFLDDVSHPPYRGLARGGFNWESTTNGALRRLLGLSDTEGGILVTRLLPQGSAASGLKEGDVVLEEDGHKLDSVGQFEHPRYGRLPSSLLYTEHKHPGDKVKLKVLRGGQRVEAEITLKRMAPEEDRVVPYRFDRRPEYFVKGGLIFQHLSRPYLQIWRDWWKRAPLRLLIEHDRVGDEPSPEHPRTVVLTRVLADAANLGYHDQTPAIIEAVNGVPAKTLDDVRAGFDKPLNGFHIIELSAGQGPRRIVLDAAEVDEAEPRIRKNYGIE